MILLCSLGTSSDLLNSYKPGHKDLFLKKGGTQVMVLSKDNPEPLLVQVLMTLRPAIFLAVFCVWYI